MVKLNPHIIIQARMGSSRLPGKVMKQIDGIPMIGYQIERLKKTNFSVTVATSIDSNNDKLVEYLEKIGVQVFRGSEDDVLKRYYDAATQEKTTHVIRITGDNPLIDPQFVLDQVEILNNNLNSERYYLNVGKEKKLPLGMSFELFPYALLKEAYLNSETNAEKEHVTPYMHQNMPGDIDFYQFETSINAPELRLTVDTDRDFELIDALITKYKCHLKSINEIIEIIRKNEYLKRINNDTIQKSWDS